LEKLLKKGLQNRYWTYQAEFDNFDEPGSENLNAGTVLPEKKGRVANLTREAVG